MPEPLRIAWTGEPGSSEAGGVAGIAYLMLEGLAARGHRIDVFAETRGGRCTAPGIEGLPNVRVVGRDTRWQWDRWYSRGTFRAFVSSSLSRLVIQRRLAADVLERHAREPYDVVFQMSQFESFFRGRDARLPLVVHPCTIVASEAYWHAAERALARKTESFPRWLAVDLILRLRARLQHRHAARPSLIVGPSRTFVAELRDRYAATAPGVVLRHPTPTPEAPPDAPPPSGKQMLLFVSRMSSRKGVELVVDLSHRLDDLRDEVELVLIGGYTLWSNYTGLLDDLNPRVARYAGEMPQPQVMEHMARATALLVPSRFEPGSIATGEALACGLPVIASSAVGPSEIIDDGGGRVFADGDASSLEAAVRDLLDEATREPDGLRRGAWTIARRELDVPRIVDRLEAILQSAARHEPFRD